MILIEKDKAIKETWEEPSYSDPLNVLTEIRDRLNTLPTIEIVRCRECKHRFVDGENVRFNVCELNHNKVQADDWFCADGERRTEQAKLDENDMPEQGDSAKFGVKTGETCTDCISRQAAIDVVRKDMYADKDWMSAIICDGIANVLNNLPSVQPERKTGKWIPVTNGRGGFECSLCHSYSPAYQNGDDYLSRFCPNCGADMRGEQDG